MRTFGEFSVRAFGVAVVGTGFIGPVHIEALRRLGQNVVGILGSSPAKSCEIAASLNVANGYESLEQLLHDPAVEVVHLTSPNRLHFEQCRAVLAANKHVVCEKPLAMSSVETSELVRLAKASDRVTAVCYNVRFYPLCLESRARVQAGELGRILHISGSYLQDWLLLNTDFNWRVLASEGGSLRAVADIGTHWIDLVCFISGLHVEEVCADLRTVHAVRQSPRGSIDTFSSSNVERVPVAVDTEDYGSVLVRFSDNASGVFTVSQVMAGRKNCIRFDIAGASASLAWDSEEPNTLTIGHHDRSNQRLTRDPSLLSSLARPFANYPGGHAEGFPDTFKQLFRSIYTTMETGEPGLFATFEDGDREVRICEAIEQSHRERRWVKVV